MLIAIKEEDRVYLAFNVCDIPSEIEDVNNLILESNIPVWKVEGSKGCIMGSNCRFYSETDHVRYSKKIVRGGLEIPNILQNIAPAIKSAIARYHHLDKRGECANDYVIAQGNRAFCITDNFECYEIEKYYAGGLNDGVPLGSLEMTDGMPVLRRIQRVFCDYQAATGSHAYPIAVMDTKSRKLKIIEKPIN